MKPLKSFKEYLIDGIVKKQSPDLSRARYLIKESENSNDFLKSIVDKIGITDRNANNIVKNAYDIIMELIRAKMLMEGFSSSGKGAHEAEVAYLRKLGFKENEVEFANQLRYFRNGILYYGKNFDAEYGSKVLDFLKKVYAKLLKANKV